MVWSLLLQAGFGGPPDGPYRHVSRLRSYGPRRNPVMKGEVLEFFRCHLTEIDPTFWAYCERYIPQRHPQ
jgi:hypothetical protein